MSQLDMLGNEIIKAIRRDKEYFDMDIHREFIQHTSEQIKNKR